MRQSVTNILSITAITLASLVQAIPRVPPHQDKGDDSAPAVAWLDYYNDSKCTNTAPGPDNSDGIVNISNNCSQMNVFTDNVGITFPTTTPGDVGVSPFTDTDCKIKGEPGAMKPEWSIEQGDNKVACKHPSRYGGEVWRSVMQAS